MDLMKNPTDLQRKHWGRGELAFCTCKPKSSIVKAQEGETATTKKKTLAAGD